MMASLRTYALMPDMVRPGDLIFVNDGWHHVVQVDPAPKGKPAPARTVRTAEGGSWVCTGRMKVRMEP